jgi:hypothetical protein
MQLRIAASVGAACLVIAAIAHAQVGGSTPASGTIGPASGSKTSWTFDPIFGAALGGTVEAECAPGICSKYSLTVKLPSDDKTFYSQYQATLTFHCSWNEPQGTDADCFAFTPTGDETGPGKPDTGDAGPNYEDVIVSDPPSGTWTLETQTGAPVPQPTTVSGTATLTITPLPASPRVPTTLDTDPQFQNYDFSPSYQTRDGANRPNAGEPSLGVDWETGNLMYMAGNQVTRITYGKGRSRPPTTTDVTPSNSHVNEDAIVFTDHNVKPNRTWALGLLLAGSYLAYTEDDGATWTPGAAFSAPAFPDHETLGAGPYSKYMTAPSHSFPDAVYYCAQTLVQNAYCGRSDDGGQSFSEPASPLWTNLNCTPIHGHVRVGPTGIVYVPNSAVAVSIDDGQTFVDSAIPDSSSGTSDPSVMEGPDGIVYFGYQAANGHPMIATATHDAKGNLHWNPSIDVGRFQDPGQTEDGMTHGVQNTEFAEVITGSPGRAAFAFLGTGIASNDQFGSFPGTWYLFVSYTTDGGKSWRTVNATPNDPVQRGCVWNGGLVNACRNMLDFNDIGIDSHGHIYVAYTDGCTTGGGYSCDTTPGIHGWNNVQRGDRSGCQPSENGQVLSSSTCTFARLSAIVDQVCGTSLIAGEDTTCPPEGNSPSISGEKFGRGGGTFRRGGPLCPRATGRLARTRLGPFSLGLTRVQARHILHRFVVQRYGFDDFCLHRNWGIRVGYASRLLVRRLSRRLAAQLLGRAVEILTANPFYSLDGVRPHTVLASVSRKLHVRIKFFYAVGLNDWYLVPGRSAYGVLKVRNGIIQEVGIADKRVIRGRFGALRFFKSFIGG